ncbi:hypothetical protein KA037_01445 [Patescibacteria group bacterium]|nr:hypothetical protein [Patescibacteria group bacterium]MBP7841327.1 hypothetical protein [Patescibacteria group bacterium]
MALNNLSKIIGDYGKVVDINGEAVASDVDYKQFAKDNFGLADKVQQANLGDVLSIQVQQV